MGHSHLPGQAPSVHLNAPEHAKRLASWRFDRHLSVDPRGHIGAAGGHLECDHRGSLLGPPSAPPPSVQLLAANS